MTNLSKCLVVFALVASLAFLGVAAVSGVGGTNYEGELDAPEFSEYHFTKSVDDQGKATWSTETRRMRLQDPKNKASAFEIKKITSNAKVLPQAMIDALTAEERYQRDRIEVLDQKIAKLKKDLADLQAAVAADKKALQARIDALIDALASAESEKAAIDKQTATTKDEQRKKTLEERRREQEIARLKHQIEILKADKLRLDQQQKKLEVLIEQMRGEVQAARERNRQLKSKQQNP